MALGNLFKSELPNIYNLVQNSFILYPKQLVISALRKYFSQDIYYKFSFDHWGFPETPDHTDLPPDAGFTDNTTTRLFIGENFRQDVVHYPAIIVRNAGARSVPISFNRERGSVKYINKTIEDGYGNVFFYKSPEHFIFAGAWEGSINIDILSRSLRARDDIVELVSILFTDIAFDDLVKSGMVVKNVTQGNPSETDDRNDKLFRQSIILEVRTEWRRQIPVSNIIEVIKFSIEFGNLNSKEFIPAPNLTINTEETFIEYLLNLTKQI